jgi:hypothetical protein
VKARNRYASNGHKRVIGGTSMKNPITFGHVIAAYIAAVAIYVVAVSVVLLVSLVQGKL